MSTGCDCFFVVPQVELKRRAGRPDDDVFVHKMLIAWLDERDETLLLAMETNIEQRSDLGDHGMWGEKDPRGNRILLWTPWFNYLDFVCDLIDFAYAKGYVFKPTSKPPREWETDDVVVWMENLRLAIYAGNVKAMGLTGVALLECNEYDLLNDVGIDNVIDRKKIMAGLINLRGQAKYEPMKASLREIREIKTLHVPGGAEGGDMMVVTDPEGRKREIQIPELTRDHTEKMAAGMEFKMTFSYQKTILNKWKLSSNTAFTDIGGFTGVIKAGQLRNVKNLWKGVTGKVKTMNIVEGRIQRQLRMSQDLVTVRLSAMEVRFGPKVLMLAPKHRCWPQSTDLTNMSYLRPSHLSSSRPVCCRRR